MSLATKIAAGLCICPVVAAPTALLHKPTRDKIARAAGYVPKARKPVSSPITVNPQIACAEPSPSGPAIAMNDLGRQGPLALSQLPLSAPGGGGFAPFSSPGSDGPVHLLPTADDGGTVIPGVPEPATWTVMVLGFGMVGAAVRRSRTPAPAASGGKDRIDA